MRIKIIRLVLVVLFALVGLALIFTQVVRGQFYFNLSVNNRIRVIPLEAPRGRILDRNGTLLADNRLAFHVSIIPQDIQDKDALFDFLSGILKTDKNTLLQTFWRKKVAPFAPVVIAEDVDKQVAMVLEENQYRFPGLYVQKAFIRYYPSGEIGAHVLGYVGKIDRAKVEQLKDYGYSPLSVVGYSGIEEYYDQFLKGKEGGLQIEVNNRGQQVRLLSLRDPGQGRDVQLAIDQRVQEIAATLLTGQAGTIIVMNLDTGSLLGMVSAPSYDPNVFMDSRLKGQKGPLFTDESAPLINRAIKGLYPPGSVFKVVVATAGLMTEKISPQKSFHCDGAFHLGKRAFRCSHVHGTQDLLLGIGHSCNVYFFNVGLLVESDAIRKFALILGLGQLTRVDLPFEEKGSVPSQSQRRRQSNSGWYKGDTLNMSIGQGEVLTTPIQLVKMMATVARRGDEVQPHLIDAIGDQKIINLSSTGRVKIPEETFDILQKGLRNTVILPDGTARVLNVAGFEISGKTGTAQSVPSKPHHAWFVGYNMTGKERIVFCVFLEYGGSSYQACMMARDLLQKMREQNII